METKKLKTAKGLIIHSENSAVLKTKATKAMNAANATVITNNGSLQKAHEILSGINLFRKAVDQEKRSMLDPANETTKRIRDFWRPIETNAEDAYRIVEKKVLDYTNELDRIADEKKAKLAKRVEGGTMKAETAVAKMDEIEEAPTVAEVKTGKVIIKTVKDVIIEDESKLPRKYLVPNRVLIRQEALAGKEIPGVKVVDKKQITNKIQY